MDKYRRVDTRGANQRTQRRKGRRLVQGRLRVRVEGFPRSDQLLVLAQRQDRAGYPRYCWVWTVLVWRALTMQLPRTTRSRSLLLARTPGLPPRPLKSIDLDDDLRGRR